MCDDVCRKLHWVLFGKLILSPFPHSLFITLAYYYGDNVDLSPVPRCFCLLSSYSSVRSSEQDFCCMEKMNKKRYHSEKFKLLDDTYRKLQSMHVSVSVGWIPGHSDIFYNDLVYKEARLRAQSV